MASSRDSLSLRCSAACMRPWPAHTHRDHQQFQVKSVCTWLGPFNQTKSIKQTHGSQCKPHCLRDTQQVLCCATPMQTWHESAQSSSKCSRTSVRFLIRWYCVDQQAKLCKRMHNGHVDTFVAAICHQLQPHTGLSMLHALTAGDLQAVDHALLSSSTFQISKTSNPSLLYQSRMPCYANRCRIPSQDSLQAGLQHTSGLHTRLKTHSDRPQPS